VEKVKVERRRGGKEDKQKVPKVAKLVKNESMTVCGFHFVREVIHPKKGDWLDAA